MTRQVLLTQYLYTFFRKYSYIFGKISYTREKKKRSVMNKFWDILLKKFRTPLQKKSYTLGIDYKQLKKPMLSLIRLWNVR